MTIHRENVRSTARLAHLELDEEEEASLLGDLDRIVGYVAQLGELDTSSVLPTSHVSVVEAPLREDLRAEGLETTLALAEGPRTRNDGFAVPAFLEEG